MMKVSFPDIDESFLRNKVSNGYYSSMSEAIRDMVRKQREREQNSLIAALEAGERDIRQGRTTALTEALFDKIVESGMAKAQKDEVIVNTDVLPQ
ncbi:MAG: hypothetical protein AAFX04_13245 [Pseudomonadota bacterium]